MPVWTDRRTDGRTIGMQRMHLLLLVLISMPVDVMISLHASKKGSNSY